MKNLRKIVGIVILLGLFACSRNEKESENESKELSSNFIVPEYDVPPPPEEATVAFTPPVIVDLKEVSTNEIFPDGKKIIYEGSMSAESQQISKTKKYIDDVLRQHDGYYEREDLEDNSFRISYDLKIRIPFKKFKRFVADLEKGKFKITRKSIEANDVTEEFKDVSIRLENKKAYLERYKKLLNNAASIKSIIEIEEIIRALEEEIESSEGRLRYLDDQAAYSTLDLVLTKEKIEKSYVKKVPSTWDKFINSIILGWNSILTFFLSLVRIWPYLLILWFLFVLGKRLWRKYVKG
jgi:hypothetical protein